MSAPSSFAFERVLHFGERHRFKLLVAALVAAVGVHAGIAEASTITAVTISTQQPLCRVGETIQLDASARSRWGHIPTITASATWTSADEHTAQSLRAGLFKCVAQGSAVITVNYANKTDVVLLKVDPAIIMIDPPKPEEPPPPPKIEEPSVAANPNVPSDTKPTAEPPPPPAAKAGKLLVAADDPNTQKSDEPTTFVHDENGQEYGSGTVAKGGTADVGKPGGKANGVDNGTGNGQPKPGPLAAAGPPPPQITAADLSRKPALPGSDQCHGWFPSDADDDVGAVTLMVKIKGSGEVETVNVMNESPKGQGFGKAARTCIASKKFIPALDHDGKPVTFSYPVTIRFTR